MFDVFVAVPYTCDDSRVAQSRVDSVNKYIVALTHQRIVAYSTVSAMDHLAGKYDLPKTYDYWKDHCEKMISSAEIVHVLMLDGWEQSEGVQDEIQVAKKLGKPIKYIHEID